MKKLILVSMFLGFGFAMSAQAEQLGENSMTDCVSSVQSNRSQETVREVSQPQDNRPEGSASGR